MRPLRVIVNADDLGMSPAVDAAIFAGIDTGYLTSTTILANGPTVERALRDLAVFPKVSVGVHLNLTEFAPLTRSVGQLLGPDGRFNPENRTVGPNDAAAVLVEWGAQIARIQGAGFRLSHLDSHQHLHQHPALFPVLRELRSTFAIPRMRGMGALRLPGTTLRGRVGAVAQRVRADRFIGRLRKDGALTTDGFASVSVFLAHAAALPAGWRTVEVMAHPGNPHSPTYGEEVARLAAGALDALPVRLEPVSWWDITDA